MNTEAVVQFWGDYKITINNNSYITKQSEIQPFIFKNEEGGKRWEDWYKQ